MDDKINRDPRAEIQKPVSVPQRLAELLASYRINPETTYINTINNVVDERVIVSRTLTEEAIQRVSDNDPPTYDLGLTDIFSAPDTFDPALRVKKFSPLVYEKMLYQLIEELG